MPSRTPDSRDLGSPQELLAIQDGTYDEVKDLLSATARKLAVEMRQAQTLQQLERMQTEEPGMLKLRRPVELDCTYTPPLAELADRTVNVATLSSPGQSLHESRLSPTAQIDDQRRHSWSGLEVVPPTDSRTATCCTTQTLLGSSNQISSKAGVHANRAGTSRQIASQSFSLIDGQTREIEQPGSGSDGSNKIHRNDLLYGIDHGLEAVNARSPCNPSITRHQRSASTPFQFSTPDRDAACRSVFTDLDMLIDVLPPRTSLHRRE